MENNKLLPNEIIQEFNYLNTVGNNDEFQIKIVNYSILNNDSDLMYNILNLKYFNYNLMYNVYFLIRDI